MKLTDFAWIRRALSTDVLAKLNELEWSQTNPWIRPASAPMVDVAQFKALIDQVPMDRRHALIVRPFNFFDDGCTTVDIHGHADAMRRANAIQEIEKMYWAAVQEGFVACNVPERRRALVVSSACAYWYQKSFFEQLNKAAAAA